MSKRMVRTMVLAAGVAALALPGGSRGDVVTLQDGSTLNGRVVSMVNDTLTIETGFGATVRVPRGKVVTVSFVDSVTVPGAGLRAATPVPGVQPATGAGRVAVTFVDKDVSSKIGVVRGKDERERLRANWIEVHLYDDDRVVYSAVDSTMDKTIYNGPERLYKNDAELGDFEVELPAGLHHLAVVVRNAGATEFEGAFDDEPLQLRLPLDNIQVVPDRTVRVRVGIEKGLLGMGSPRLRRVE